MEQDKTKRLGDWEYEPEGGGSSFWLVRNINPKTPWPEQIFLDRLFAESWVKQRVEALSV